MSDLSTLAAWRERARGMRAEVKFCTDLAAKAKQFPGLVAVILARRRELLEQIIASGAEAIQGGAQ